MSDAPTNALVLSPRFMASPDEIVLRDVPEGLTVLALLVMLEREGALDRELRPWVRVTIGDQVIAPAAWPMVRPKAGVVLFVDIAPAGKSNVGRTIAQLAVIVGSYLAFGPLGSAAVAAAIFAGNMAIDALIPIKQPELRSRTERYSLNGASNAADPYGQVLILLGRRRIFPRRCANWYTVTIDNTVYLRQMFRPALDWHERETPRIGETPLDSFAGVTVRWNTKPTDGLTPIWFDRTPAEDSYGLVISQDAGWVTRSFAIEADAVSFDIAFLGGLFDTKASSGAPINRSVDFEFRYGPVGGEPDAATPIPYGVAGVVTFTRDKIDSWRETFGWDVDLGQYDLHVRRVTADAGNNTKISDALTLVCLRAFRDQPAVRDAATLPWIELELQASEQLSGIPDNFNFIGTSMARQVIPAEGETPAGLGDLIVTRNPADLFAAVSLPPYSDVELDEDERRYDVIAAWRAVCEAQGWTCDLADEQEMSVGELLQRVAAAGRARPTLDYGALSVVVDWEKPLPRQMFTPRNISGFQAAYSWEQPVDALRLRFANQDKDYDDDMAVVFAAGQDEDTATAYQSVEIRDKTDPDQVEWEGARMLAERLLRPETFSFVQDWEYLTVKEGERALLAHHVALIGQRGATVLSRVTRPSGDGLVTGLRLDELIVMRADRSYDLAWRPVSKAPVVTIGLQTRAGSRYVVWLDEDLEDLPQPGDLVTVGEHAIGVLDVVIDSITPKDDMSAAITCVAYAPGLQAIGEDPIPALRTASRKAPVFGGAALTGRSAQGVDRALLALSAGVTEAASGVDGAVSDDLLNPSEKVFVVPQIMAMLSARTDLRAAADSVGLTVGQAVRDAYDAAQDALDDILDTLTSPTDWYDLSGDTDVDGAVLAVANAAALNAERALQSAISAAAIAGTGVGAPLSADWSGLLVDDAAAWIAAADVDLDVPAGAKLRLSPYLDISAATVASSSRVLWRMVETTAVEVLANGVLGFSDPIDVALDAAWLGLPANLRTPGATGALNIALQFRLLNISQDDVDGLAGGFTVELIRAV
jgi:hypothetical protein